MNSVPVLPTEVLLVSFDLTHGAGNELCIVGKKDGEMVTIVNAFEGQRAKDIFAMLTSTERRKNDEQK